MPAEQDKSSLLWLWILLGLGAVGIVVMVLGGFAVAAMFVLGWSSRTAVSSGPVIVSSGAADARTSAPAEAPALDWSKATVKTSIADVDIELIDAHHATTTGTRFGKFVNLGQPLVAGFKFTNRSTTRIVNFKGWRPELTDEHGNKLDELDVPSNFGFSVHPFYSKDCDSSNVTAGAFDLYPGKCYMTCLMFQPAPDVSKEIRLIVSAKAFGGEGPLLFRKAITRP
jgi:hypothetical protein